MAPKCFAYVCVYAHKKIWKCWHTVVALSRHNFKTFLRTKVETKSKHIIWYCIASMFSWFHLTNKQMVSVRNLTICFSICFLIPSNHHQ